MAADRQPFVGPRPFAREDADRFFGRSRELLDLAALVVAHPIVFLYGQSGTGKTSLLHAGIIPLLEVEHDFFVLPVVRPGGLTDRLDAARTTAGPFVAATVNTWAPAAGGAASADTDLAEFLAGLPPERDEDGDPKPRLLIFDQLEEIFRDEIDVYQEQHEFFAQIGEVLRQARHGGGRDGGHARSDPVPTRVLLAMREEYIAQLDTFAALLPERLRTRYRLERLRAPAALEAINGPLRETPFAFVPGVAEQLVNELREVRIESGAGEARRAINVLGEFVEPVQLQVVCQRLLRELPPEATEITFAHLSTLGSVDATLTEFYKDAIAFAAAQSGVRADDLERWCETNLVTETGTRAVVHRGPTQSNGIPNAAPDALVARLLLRREPRAGAEWYELTHDRLIGPIQEARLSRERREAEEREAAEARRRQVAERRVRLLVAGIAAVAVAAYVAAAVYFGGQRPACIGTLTCLWQFRTGGEIFGRPAIDGAVAYVPSIDGRVYAIDTAQPAQIFATVRDGATRQLLWEFPTGNEVWSSPALAGGVLYVGSANGNLYALDPATGREVGAGDGSAAAASDGGWPFSVDEPIVTSPVVVDGVVYFGSFDRNLYAVSAESGRERWRFPSDGQVASSPAVAGGAVFFGNNNGSVYAVDTATGKARWRFATGGAVRSAPAVVDGVVYVGSFDANVYALDAASGKVRWRFTTGERVRSSPAVVDGVVYIGSYDTHVYALDARTGAEIWQFGTGGWVVASPLVHDGVVYVGSNDGRFYALDAVSGAELGRITADGIVESFPAVLGDEIIFGSSGGSVYAIARVSRSDENGPAPGGPATPVAGAPGTPPAATPPRATPLANGAMQRFELLPTGAAG